VVIVDYGVNMRRQEFNFGPKADRFRAPLLITLLSLGGCQSKATRQCQTEFQNAQIVVQNAPGTLDGIDAGLLAVNHALADCTAAKRDDEAKQLKLVQETLTRNADTIKGRSSRQKRPKPTPAELEALAKHGDPNCPKGMAYRAAGLEREIKCTGLQPFRMNWQKAKTNYSNLNYHVVTTTNPPSIRAERGSELFVFTYGKVDDAQPPRCLTMYPDATIPWQEAVSRATGVAVNALKQGAPLKTSEGEVPMRIDEGPNKLVIHLGQCGR